MDKFQIVQDLLLKTSFNFQTLIPINLTFNLTTIKKTLENWNLLNVYLSTSVGTKMKCCFA